MAVSVTGSFQLTLLETTTSGINNGAANVITSKDMDNVLAGSAEADRFVVCSGDDLIRDFDVAEDDSLNISGSYRLKEVGRQRGGRLQRRFADVTRR